jgi:hypothetical protein
MIVWGGFSGGSVIGDGGRYDPAADTWKPLVANGPSARYNQTAVWTGSAMVVWGGNDLFNWHSDGSSFDPVAASWTPTPASGAPSAREAATSVWTGSAMVVWGGWTGGPYAGDGGSLPLPGGAWTALSSSAAPSARSEHTAVWTGDRMVIWGGCGMDTCAQLYGDGASWKPDGSGGLWTPIAASPDVAARSGATGVWTGTSVVVWGGKTSKGETDTGALLFP